MRPVQQDCCSWSQTASCKTLTNPEAVLQAGQCVIDVASVWWHSSTRQHCCVSCQQARALHRKSRHHTPLHTKKKSESLSMVPPFSPHQRHAQTHCAQHWNNWHQHPQPQVTQCQRHPTALSRAAQIPSCRDALARLQVHSDKSNDSDSGGAACAAPEPPCSWLQPNKHNTKKPPHRGADPKTHTAAVLAASNTC